MEAVIGQVAISIVARTGSRNGGVAICGSAVGWLPGDARAPGRNGLREIPEGIITEILLPDARAAIDALSGRAWGQPEAAQIIVEICASLGISGIERVCDGELLKASVRIPSKVSIRRRSINRQLVLRHAARVRVIGI